MRIRPKNNSPFTVGEVKQIYDTLEPYDKFVIDDLAEQLCASLPNFGVLSALELLMQLGAWMVENDFGKESK